MSFGEEDGGSEVDLETLHGRSWPTVTQYSVFLENRVGQLLDVYRSFQGSRVKIVGLTISDSADCSILRLILSHSEQGREILVLNKHAFAENELLVVELPAGPQSLSDLCMALLQAEINIHYAYPLLGTPAESRGRGHAHRQRRAGQRDAAQHGFRGPLRGGPRLEEWLSRAPAAGSLGCRRRSAGSRTCMNRGLAAKLSWTEIDPETVRLQSLTARLAEHDGPADAGLEWPGELWSLLEHAGATRWSLSEDFGGEGCPRPLLVQRYATTGRWEPHRGLHPVSARRRRAPAYWPRRKATSPLAGSTAIGKGRAFTTVGISHLTTSRRLGPQPVKAVRGRARELSPRAGRCPGSRPPSEPT